MYLTMVVATLVLFSSNVVCKSYYCVKLTLLWKSFKISWVESYFFKSSSQKLIWTLSKLLYFDMRSEFKTSQRQTKNCPALIWKYWKNFLSKRLLCNCPVIARLQFCSGSNIVMNCFCPQRVVIRADEVFGVTLNAGLSYHNLTQSEK